MRTRQWILMLLIAACFAFVIRMFVFETVRVATPSMAETFQTGDRLMIEKLSLGARLPMSIGIPFMPDSLPIGKTFIALTRNAKRLPGTGSIQRNDILAFNQPNRQIVYSRNPVLLSRCVGLPGELIQIQKGLVRINHKPISRPANTILCYSIPRASFIDVNRLLMRYGISSTLFQKQDTGYVYLSRSEWLLLYKDKQFASLSLKKVSTAFDERNMRIPYKGMKIELNDSTLKLYGTAIRYFEHVSISKTSSGTYLKNGLKSNRYVFKYNYYYVLNDHQGFLNDSRSLGVIPEQLIVGKASLVLFSPKTKRFMQGF